MLKGLLAGSCIALLLVMTCGCHKSEGIVGTWKTSQSNQGSDATMTFNPDKTMSFTAANGPKQIPYKLTGIGTWSCDGKQLTVTPLAMDLNGLPDEAKAKLMPYIKAQINVPQSGPVQWKGEDEFICTKNGVAQHFKRIK